MKKIISLLMIFFFSISMIFAETENAQNVKDEAEVPEWAAYLRRTEIITFGSMPFVTIGVSLIYGATLYFSNQIPSFPNPLDKSTNYYSPDQQLQIVGISLGVSGIFGITDLVMNVLKDKKKKIQIEKKDEANKIIVEPLSEDEVVFRRIKSEEEDFDFFL